LSGCPASSGDVGSVLSAEGGTGRGTVTGQDRGGRGSARLPPCASNVTSISVLSAFEPPIELLVLVAL